MEQFPFIIYLLFIAAVLLTLFFFFRATRFSRPVILGSLAWLLLSGWLASAGFYSNLQAMPPRMVFAVAPPLLFIFFLFVSKSGRRFIDRTDPAAATLLHVVRIPVELTLLLLFKEKWVPQIMTFEGNNLDIISGISAPVVYYLVFVRKQSSQTLLLVWNVVCLLLLFNIVITAILAVPYPFQQLAFDQPNRAVLYFPFTWLPAFIVPVVLFSHLVTIRQLVVQRVRKEG